ncbi:hypothetical protein ND991_21905 [Gordonia sputi]|uniref:hypothetical protein n=1 Tax=Gordonia sputi TaxID=36823 RepID=UPI0020442F47|nr:hypothetical protein [Gordonia sputi]MCM3897859.1 hypothetical protein [Gordonia sputi]
MSAISDFLTQPGFWWGVPLGAVVTGVVGPVITARSVRASDGRKAAQDNAKEKRQAEREDKKSNQKLVREATTAYGEVCTSIMEKATDVEGIFNAIRDADLTSKQLKDPKEIEKLEFTTNLVNETMRLTTAFNNLRLVCPNSILDKATQLNAAMMAITRATTAPIAKPLLFKEAGQALEAFTNAVRIELDLDPYTTAEAEKAFMSYMETLKKQVDDYIQEAKNEAQKLGFLDLGSVSVIPKDTADVRPYDAVVTTKIKAGELTPGHVGRLIGCHSPMGYNYGAKLVEVKRDEKPPNPGMLVRIIHPAMPGVGPARQDRVRFRFDQELEMIELPDAE